MFARYKRWNIHTRVLLPYRIYLCICTSGWVYAYDLHATNCMDLNYGKVPHVLTYSFPISGQYQLGENICSSSDKKMSYIKFKFPFILASSAFGQRIEKVSQSRLFHFVIKTGKENKCRYCRGPPCYDSIPTLNWNFFSSPWPLSWSF